MSESTSAPRKCGSPLCLAILSVLPKLTCRLLLRSYSSISYIHHSLGSVDDTTFVPQLQEVFFPGWTGRIPTVFDLNQHGGAVLDTDTERISSSPIVWPKLALLHYDCRPRGPLATRLAQKAEAS